MNSYTVVLTHEEDGRVSASVPALPGCHTWGETQSDAIAMVHEAIELYLEELRESNQSAPSNDSIVITTIEVA